MGAGKSLGSGPWRRKLAYPPSFLQDRAGSGLSPQLAVLEATLRDPFLDPHASQKLPGLRCRHLLSKSFFPYPTHSSLGEGAAALTPLWGADGDG